MRGTTTMATKTRAKTAKTSSRTTHRSSRGTKLYAVRAADGTFKDIQTYKRAHGADVKRKSAAETAKAAPKTTTTRPKKASKKK